MKKLTALALALLVCSAPMVYAGAAASPGPAPNSADGVSDGSGLDPRPGPNAASPTAVALMASARSDSCNDGTEGLSRLFRRRPASSDAYPAGSTDALGTPTTPASCRGCYWWRTNVCCLEKRKSGHGRTWPVLPHRTNSTAGTWRRRALDPLPTFRRVARAGEILYGG